MIGKLTGILDSKGDGYAVIDVNGIGFRVFCSSKTLSSLPSNGEAVRLYIETVVREDFIHLFGFLTESDKTAFDLLTTVPGMGAKGALSVLSVASASELGVILMSKDVKRLTLAPGIGKKLAERIIGELQGKAALLGGENVSVASAPVGQAGEETLSALVNLGYARSEVAMIVAKILKDQPMLTTAETLRLSLKEIGKSKNG